MYEEFEADPEEFKEHYGTDIDPKDYTNENQKFEDPNLTSVDQITPTQDRVLIERIPREDRGKTQSGLIIPNDMDYKSLKGKVISTGKNVNFYEEGDVVIFRKGSGVETVINGKDILIKRENAVLARKRD